MNSQELAPYFSLGSCMEGLNKLFESLFDVTLEPAGTGYGELWSPEVIKLVSFKKKGRIDRVVTGLKRTLL